MVVHNCHPKHHNVCRDTAFNVNVFSLLVSWSIVRLSPFHCTSCRQFHRGGTCLSWPGVRWQLYAAITRCDVGSTLLDRSSAIVKMAKQIAGWSDWLTYIWCFSIPSVLTALYNSPATPATPAMTIVLVTANWPWQPAVRICRVDAWAMWILNC